VWTFFFYFFISMAIFGQAVPAGLPQTAPAGQGLHGMNNPSHQLLSHGKKWNPPVGGFI
jgi:hypothetical protein